MGMATVQSILSQDTAKLDLKSDRGKKFSNGEDSEDTI